MFNLGLTKTKVFLKSGLKSFVIRATELKHQRQDHYFLTSYIDNNLNPFNPESISCSRIEWMNIKEIFQTQVVEIILS